MSDTAAPTGVAQKPRRTLTRAVIRFAGDSGDGMQVTGEQFTTEAAWAGNDISTLPNFPAEIRAPAGTLFGVSSFQLQFGSQRVYTPGDLAGLPRRHEPGRPQGAPARPQAGRDPRREHRGLRPAQHGQGGLRQEPAPGSRARREVPRVPGRHQRHDDEGARGPPAQRQGQGALQELLRPRPGVVDLHAAARPHAGRHQEALREEPDLRRGQHPRPQGRPRLRRDGGDVRRALRRRGGRDGAGRLPEHDGQPGARVGAPRRGPADADPDRVRGVSDHAGQQHPRRAGHAQALPRADVPGRGRDRRRHLGHRRGVRRRHRRHRVERPRHRPQGRGHRAGGDGRASRS